MHRRVLYWLFSLSISVIALSFALWGINFRQIATILSEARFIVIGPFLLSMLLFYACTALRWSVLLRPVGAFRSWQLTPTMMIGFAANNVLPARAGEVVRAALFARQAGVPTASVLITIIMERLCDIWAVLLYFAIAWWFLPPLSAELSSALAVFFGASSAGFLGIALLLAYPQQMERLWKRIWSHLPVHWSSRAETLLRDVLVGAKSIGAVRNIAYIVVYSLCKWCAPIVMGWFALWSVGISLSLPQAVLLMVVVTLVISVPSAPGFIGTMQAAFVIALTPFGVAQEQAIAASVLFLVLNWPTVTFVGGVFLLRLGGGMRSRPQIKGV